MRRMETKGAIMAVVLVLVVAVLWMAAAKPGPEPKLTYSEFIAAVQTGNVASVTVIGSSSGAARAECRLTNGSAARTVLPADYTDALRALQDKAVKIEIRDSSTEPVRLLINVTPFLVLLAAWFFMMRRLRNGPRQGLLG